MTETFCLTSAIQEAHSIGINGALAVYPELQPHAKQFTALVGAMLELNNIELVFAAQSQLVETLNQELLQAIEASSK